MYNSNNGLEYDSEQMMKAVEHMLSNYSMDFDFQMNAKGDLEVNLPEEFNFQTMYDTRKKAIEAAAVDQAINRNREQGTHKYK